MESKFWIDSWNSLGDQTPGFHLQAPNSQLVKNLPLLNLEKGSSILVPLCGKTVDLIYLSKNGYQVIGIELSEVAIKSFFKENNLSFDIDNDGKFKRFSSGNITIFQGDFFNLNTALISKVDLIYDRAALVALPLAMREKYFNHLKSFLKDDGRVLLILLSRSPQTNDGPPHSVPLKEVQNYSTNFFEIKELESSNEKIKSKSLQEKGIDSMTKTTLILNRI